MLSSNFLELLLSQMEPCAVLLKEISFHYHDRSIFQKLSLAVSCGSFISVIGKSGSGKTTLLRLIASLEKPTEGFIEVPFPLTYMPQKPLLLPRRTILENLMLLQELDFSKKKAKKEWFELSQFFLNEVGLYGQAHFYPNELSLGMQSRAVLARTLLEEKPLLLLDEPFASLDAITREEMQSLISSLQKKYKKTVLLVTHDILEALKLSSQIFLLGSQRIQYCWNVPPSSSQYLDLSSEIFKALK